MAFVRAQIRIQYKRMGLSYPSNGYLEKIGVRQLTKLKKGKLQAIPSVPNYLHQKAARRKKRNTQTQSDTLFNYLENFDNQNKQMIHLLEKLTRQNTELLDM